MENLNTQVLKNFNINPQNIKKHKSHYLCYENSSVKIISKVNCSKKHILFQHDIKQHLIYNGFCNIDKFYLTIDDKPYCDFMGNIYVMTDEFNYKELNFSDEVEFLKLVSEISKMKKCLKTINLKEDYNFYAQDIKTKYKNSKKNILNIRKIIANNKRLSNFDMVFLKNYEIYLDLINATLHSLEQFDSSVGEEFITNRNSISHNFLKRDNLFFYDNYIHITNFTKTKIDSNLTDLSTLIKYHFKWQNSNPLKIEKILEEYSKYNTLNKNEIKVLYAILLYPNKFIKSCNEYYIKKRKWIPTSLNIKMENILKNRDLYYNYIEQLKNY